MHCNSELLGCLQAERLFCYSTVHFSGLKNDTRKLISPFKGDGGGGRKEQSEGWYETTFLISLAKCSSGPFLFKTCPPAPSPQTATCKGANTNLCFHFLATFGVLLRFLVFALGILLFCRDAHVPFVTWSWGSWGERDRGSPALEAAQPPCLPPSVSLRALGPTQKGLEPF